MKQLNFEDKYNEVMKRLENENTIVLSTSYKDNVTSRSIWFILYESSIYFVTSKAYTKCKQIEKNPNVALCLDNIQIEGIAKIKGNCSLKENELIRAYCERKHTGMIHYLKYKNSIFIEVKINKIQLWKKGREYIDVVEKIAYR
jgi:uncharacterized pyridoxamine 5'-phosphate oxidase family protein